MFRHFLSSTAKFLLTNLVLPMIARPIRRRLTQFEAMTTDPQRVQAAMLKDILAHQAKTAFGVDHHFASIKEVADFRHNVSVAGYEAIEPYIARVRKGETNALLADPKIYMFAMTSGTTATRKFIPVTDSYLENYKRSWNIWGLKVFRDHREVLLRPMVQMSGDMDEFRTEAGIPCGAVTGLTATMQKRIVRFFYCVPAAVSRIKDPQAKYYTVMRLSVPKAVAMLVAANPSTMLNLARSADEHRERLIRDIHDGTLTPPGEISAEVRQLLKGRIKANRERAKELEAIVQKTGNLYLKDAWPAKFLLGNWTGGSVGAYLRHYPKYFGENPVRDVGLIASEGRMTIPFDDHTASGVLDISSHFFEFIPEAEINSPQPTVLGAHELIEGGRYFILLTTSYGLYRYNIYDLVRVTGFFNKTPLIEFLSKGAHFANLTGEKLSEYHVTQAMVKILRDLQLQVSTWSVAPCWPEDDKISPWYGLFLEEGELAPEAAQRLARAMEAEVCQQNIEYEAKRSSARLGTMQVMTLPRGFWATWDKARLQRNGGTLEQYKHPCLINDVEFYHNARKLGMVG